MSSIQTPHIENIVTINIHNQERAIPINEIPKISPQTREIFRNLGARSVPDGDCQRPDFLKEKVTSLENSIQRLEDAKNSAIKDNRLPCKRHIKSTS